MRRLGRVNDVDRGSSGRASVTWSKNDVYQALDQFAERLFSVTNQESDEIVKQVGRNFRT